MTDGTNRSDYDENGGRCPESVPTKPLRMELDGTRCTCDFCTGKKLHNDNWCARCGDVKMEPPKWWENLDVCDACEKEMEAENPPAPQGEVR